MIRSVLAVPIVEEPLTLAQAKLRAGLDWVPDQARDDLMISFISAARQQVEQDTGLALPTQTRDLFFDDPLPTALTWRELPSQSTPLVSVDSVSYVDSTGAILPLAAADYTVTITNDGLTITVAAIPEDAQRWIVRIVAGFDPLPPALFQAVGVLTGHLATVGRDVTIDERRVGVTPLGYLDTIRPWRLEVLP